MKYKCDVCGEEFNDIGSATRHEKSHAEKEPAGIDERISLLEEHVKELRALAGRLEREKRFLESRIAVLESERAYNSPMPGQPPKWPEYWWTCDKMNDGFYVTNRTDGYCKEFPGINKRQASGPWHDAEGLK